MTQGVPKPGERRKRLSPDGRHFNSETSRDITGLTNQSHMI